MFNLFSGQTDDTPELCPFQMGAMKVCPFQMGALEICTTKIYSAQIKALILSISVPPGPPP